ncbi:hypothetical protein CFY87_04055 [Actinobacillus seminis]|nr:hypothetical protein [Actinobacillus seminis]OZN25319.1 hypothetical protein CFY87_04055 [Actinobacillus seminis]
MLKRLSLYTLLLCFVPLFTLIFCRYWQLGNGLGTFEHFLGGFKETGSVPYAFISGIILTLSYFLRSVLAK